MTLPSSYISTGQLEQWIRHAANGTVLSLDKRRKALGYDKLQELECQALIPIFGTSSSGVGWTTVGIPFGIDFVYAPNQRDIPFTIPNFTSGAAAQGHRPPGAPADPGNPNCVVGILVTLIDWARDLGKDTIIGAQVAIGVTEVGGEDIDFNGYVHLRFQGYGSPIEDVTALDVGQ